MDLDTSLQFVKGIGPARAEMLAAKGLLTVSDLLYYAPFRYEDRRNVKTIAMLAPGEKAAVIARVVSGKMSGFKWKALGLFDVIFRDESGKDLLARWFHGERYVDSLTPDTRVAPFGKVELDRSSGNRMMIQPEIEVLSDEDDADSTLHSGRAVAVYETAGRITTRVFRSLLNRILERIGISNALPVQGCPHNLRITSLMLRPNLGAAWLAWKIWPPVGFGAAPLAVAGPPSQRAAPPAWRPRRPSLELWTSGPLPAR